MTGEDYEKQVKVVKKPKLPGVDSVMNLPTIPPGEDVTSFQRHNKVLLIESKKAHPNMLVVGDLMERTFAMRRRDILESSYDINTILSKYPFLQNGEQVSLEN